MPSDCRAWILFAAFLVLVPCRASAANLVRSVQQQPASRPLASSAAQRKNSPPGERKVAAYTLSPELYKKAKALNSFRFRFGLFSFCYGLFVLWLLLRVKFTPKLRDRAEKFSPRLFFQVLVFSPPLILTIGVLLLPASAWRHAVSLAYGISVQGWRSWAWDWVKAQFLLIVLGTFLIWILYAVIRRSPRRWWCYFWLISLPIIFFLAFLEPYVLEPMFFKFAPLELKDPALVEQIERVVRRAGLEIPPERMFWMKASEKTNAMNAYVSGLGASKRVVVWDTNIAKETTPEIVSDFGHEMGHYVLGHVWKGLLFAATLMFVLFYLGFRSIGWLLARWGTGWHIRGVDDLASLPALLLLLSIFNFISDPLSNAYSRHVEHRADIYGLEVTHGVIPDAGQAAADSFQIEGESYLADPDPNPVDIFLFYDHPPISDRIRLCLTYDPWSKGEATQFVH
jgi:STE24 endopeptidase